MNSSAFGSLFGGMLLMVIGYALLQVIISSAADAGANTEIGSFTGTQGISDLGPLAFSAVVIAVGVGLIAVAGLGFAGRGPLASS